MTYSDFFRIIKRRILYILIASLVLSEAFFFVSAFVLPETHEVSAVFCIRNREDVETGISGADITASDALVEAGIVLMEGMHDGIGELAFDKLGAGVFRVTLQGSDEDAMLLSLESLAETASQEIPKLLGCSSLTVITPIGAEEMPKNAAASAILGAVVGFSASVVVLILLEKNKLKKGNTTDKEEI